MKLFFTIFILFMMPLSDSSADTIYLKNKRQMEGLITNESGAEVTLDVGCGAVTVPKNDIERIEKSSKKEEKEIIKTWQAKYMESGRWIPKGAEDLYTALNEVKKKRNEVIVYKQKRENLQYTIDTEQKTLSELFAKSGQLNTQLSQANRQSDVFVYNKLVAEINVVSAKIGKITDEFKANTKRKEEQDLEFSNYMMDYMEKVSSFAKYFNDEYAKLNTAGIPEDDRNFYRWLQEETGKFQKDFERREVAFSKDRAGIVVDVILNDNVKALLILDTGASLVTITKKVADQLNIPENKKGRKLELVMANGKTHSAVSVILDSVDVGGSKVKNVMAAIVDEPPEAGIDGLLGMSFLGNFLVKIDSNSNKVVLEGFNPS